MNRFNLISFLSGMLFCVLFISIYSFNTIKLDVTPVQNVTQVSNSTANSLRSNYKYKNPDSSTGFNISIEQLNTMNIVMNEMGGKSENPAGFRVYHGLNSSNKRVSLIYTLNSELQEPNEGSTKSSENVGMAQSMDENFTEQCPPYCD